MTTRLTMYYYRSGMGDLQAVEQFTDAFERFVAEDDPGWGDVVIAAGMHGDVMIPRKGDLNLYWWWSGSETDDWLEHYTSHVAVKPEAILCTSLKMFDHAKGRGYRAIYLPVATGLDFFPMDLPRSGTGFCGTPHHMDREQEQCMIDPARPYGFQWLTYVDGGRPVLNQWYNRWSVCLGMTAGPTLAWGIVPTRTYEVLAGANPYLTYRHWAMEETLGFTYPYQSSSAAETAEWIEELINNYEGHREEFVCYSEIVRREHTWDRRMVMLKEGLES